MVLDPEFPLDHDDNPALGPSFGLETGRLGTTTEDPEELAPLGRAQGGHPAGRGAAMQAADPFLLQSLLPPGHRGAADPQLPGNLGLGRLLGPDETSSGQPAFLQLVAGESSRLPSHGSTSQRSHSP
jgi:hypothetical protein